MELVKCKRCESIVSESHINREEKVANCQRCGNLFSLQNLDHIATAKPKSNSKAEVYEIPKNIEIEKYSFELKIISKSNGFAKYFLTFFAIFWNTIVFGFAFGMIAAGEFFPLLFLSAHLIVGIGVGYYALSMHINKHKILVNARGLYSSYGPLKFPLKKEYQVDLFDINQIYVMKYRMGSSNGVAKYGFKVMLQKNDGEAIQIMNNLGKYQQGLYIEQQIESYLKIEDRKISDEYQVGN